jgi:hypothetical protein
VLGILAGSLIGMVVARMACDRWLMPYSRNAVVWSFSILMAGLLVSAVMLFDGSAERTAAFAPIIGTAVSVWVVFRRATL